MIVQHTRLIIALHGLLSTSPRQRGVHRSKLALSAVVMPLALLYQRFTFRLCPQHHPDGQLHTGSNVVCTPQAGMWVVATPRHAASEAS